MPALLAKKDKPVRIGDKETVVEKMVAVVKQEGIMKVLWAMCAKFVGFMWDPIAHSFKLRYLAWIVRRDFQVRIRGSGMDIRCRKVGHGKRFRRSWTR